MKNFILIYFLIYSLGTLAQLPDVPYQETPKETKKTESKKFDEKIKDKIFYGGNLGLQFGTFTFIDLSPMVGYRVTDRFHLGAGYTFNYISNRLTQRTLIIRGYRGFARYFLTSNLFTHAEYESLQGVFPFDNKAWLSTFLAGIGYRQQIASRAFLDFQLLYNFSSNPYSPYSNPVIRGGVIFR